jgi:hypothetical protein
MPDRLPIEAGGGVSLMQKTLFVLIFARVAVPAGIAQQGGPQFGGGQVGNYNGYAFVSTRSLPLPR